MGSLFYCNPSVTACAVPAPRRGEPFWCGTSSNIKPALKEEVDMSVSEWTEGLQRGFCCLRQPLSLTFGSPAPRRGAPLGAVQTRRTVPYPSRSDRFNGVTGGAGGPKGRNRNLPWPPCKKVIKKLAVLFYSLRPLVLLAATSLDREAFSAILYAKIFELTLRLEQGRLTHCRS